MAVIPQYQDNSRINYVENVAPERPGQVNNFIGSSLQQAGNQIENLGQETYAVGLDKQQQQQTQDSQIWASNAYSQAVLDWNQDLNTRKANLQGPGTGFSQQFNQDFTDYKADLISKAPNPETKKTLEQQLTGLQTRLVTDAQDYQTRTYANYQTHKVQDAIRNSGKASAATQGATAEDSINNLSLMISKMDGIPQEQKFRLIDSAHSEMFEDTINTMTINNPTVAQEYISPAIGKYPAGSNESKIIQSTKETNVSPLTALALMGSESGLSSTAKNPNSTAYGALQFTDATWKEYGGTAENRSDIDKQIELGTKYIADQQNYLRSTLGRDPTPAELKAGVVFRRNADKVINANPDTPIESIIGKKAADANNMSGKTTGQVMQSFNNTMNQQIKKYSGDNNYLVKTATASQLFNAANKIQEALNQQAAAQRFTFNQTVQDHEAMARTGQMPQTLLTEQAFLNMYPKDQAQGQAEYNNYRSAMKVGNYVSQLANMNPAQAQETYESLAPQPNESGFAARAQDQQLFAKAMQQKAQALKDDPVSFVQMNSTLVNGKYRTMLTNPNDPQAQHEYYASLIGEQQRQGIPYPKLLSKAQENNAIQQIQNTTGMQRATVLQTMSQQYGDFWPQAAGQLQQNKALPSGTVSIMTAPTLSAMQAAANVADVKLSDIQKTFPDHKALDDEIQSQLSTFFSSFPVEARSNKNVSDLADTISKVAYQNYLASNKHSTNAATKSAIDMFVGADKYNYINNKGSDRTVRIPRKYNSDNVQKNLRSTIDNLDINSVDTAGATLLRNAWNMQEDANGYLNQIKSTGYWETNADETGARLFFIGHDNVIYPVKDKSGSQITQSFENINAQKSSNFKAPGLQISPIVDKAIEGIDTISQGIR